MPGSKLVMHVTMKWGKGTGGVKCFIRNAVRALPQNEYKQVVVSIGPVTGESQGFELLGSILGENSIAHLGSMGKLKEYFERTSPDIVHIHCNNGVGVFCAEAARRAGVPVRVVHSHSSSLGSSELSKRIADSYLKVRYSNSPTVCIACSKLAGDWLFRNRLYQIVRNGIDASQFAFSSEERQRVRQRYGIAENEYVFLLVGAGIPVKNSAYALNVVEELHQQGKNVHLLMVGEGAQIEQLMAFSKSLKCGNYVHFSGTVSDVWNYYSASDVLLMPSYYEGLPLTLIEAQTNALPCVVSDVVSSESDVTGCIKFLPLSDMTCWIQTAYERAEIGFERNGEVAAETYELVCKAGYSLDTLKRRLIQIYSGGALY